jgi:hypothetical protein
MPDVTIQRRDDADQIASIAAQRDRQVCRCIWRHPLETGGKIESARPVPGGYWMTCLSSCLGVARGAGRIVLRWITDSARKRRKVAIVVSGYVGVKSTETETLKQVRLPQIADVIVNAGSFGPSPHRPWFDAKTSRQRTP